MSKGPTIVFEDVHLYFGERKILQGVNLTFPSGKTSVVIGPSGCGKSTTLRLVSGLLKSVLEPLNYQNLDELPELAGRNTTTEVLAREICERVRERIRAGALGEEAKTALESVKVTLRESHLAWASYETRLQAG